MGEARSQRPEDDSGEIPSWAMETDHPVDLISVDDNGLKTAVSTGHIPTGFVAGAFIPRRQDTEPLSMDEAQHLDLSLRKNDHRP